MRQRSEKSDKNKDVIKIEIKKLLTFGNVPDQEYPCWEIHKTNKDQFKANFGKYFEPLRYSSKIHRFVNYS